MILFHSYISSWVVRHVIVGNVKFHFSYNQTGLDITKGLSTPLDLLWNILETWEDDLHKGEDRLFMGCLNSSASFLIQNCRLSASTSLLLFPSFPHLLIAAPSCPLLCFLISISLCATLFLSSCPTPRNTVTCVPSSRPFFSSLATSDCSL